MDANSNDRKIVTARGGQILWKVGDITDPATCNWDDDLVRQVSGQWMHNK